MGINKQINDFVSGLAEYMNKSGMPSSIKMMALQNAMLQMQQVLERDLTKEASEEETEKKEEDADDGEQNET